MKFLNVHAIHINIHPNAIYLSAYNWQLSSDSEPIAETLSKVYILYLGFQQFMGREKIFAYHFQLKKSFIHSPQGLRIKNEYKSTF